MIFPTLTQAGAAADAFDVLMMTVVLGTIGVALLVNLASAFSFWWNRWR
jgi:hypothetical protein